MIKLHSFHLYGIILLSISISSCATIVGGTNYNTKVVVKNHPNAQIEYNGVYQGSGIVAFPAKRKDSNNFTITIKEEGCKTEIKRFNKKVFRGWAFMGSLLGWTGLYMGVPLPWGLLVDGITGAWWKPDISEIGVVKQDYNNYIYTIDYRGCEDKTVTKFKLENKPLPVANPKQASK